MTDDVRRLVPRTDDVLAHPDVVAALDRMPRSAVKVAVAEAQELVRSGYLGAGDVVDAALARLPDAGTSLRAVINATGVVLHTNLGRAPLADEAREAMLGASGYVDVEFDLATGQRARRGRGAIAALLAAAPDAEDAVVLNNGAAALLLATAAIAAGRDIVISRGELVEIGDGFRLPELISSGGGRLREVGTTNRTSLRDYADAVGPGTGCILKVHPSNFRIHGFTSSVDVGELSALGPPVVVDIGSGLLAADALLPDEPDAASALRAGAAVVTASGDKLLGGPQAGIALGRSAQIQAMRNHPLARALRCDKLTLAALEATMRAHTTPTYDSLHAAPEDLRLRAVAVAESLVAQGIAAAAVASEGAVGGGGAPGVTLPGWAVSLPDRYATNLREGSPPVVGRVERGRCLLDLRCVPAAQDDDLLAAVLAAR
jgi:L-seryl-tRNA(Ser) seleniumtransferase